MTLHQAIVQVLEQSKCPLTTGEIADVLNARKLYKKGDGSSIKSSQISARIRKYPHLFNKQGSYVTLSGKKIETPPKPARKVTNNKTSPIRTSAKISSGDLLKLERDLLKEKWFMPVPQASHNLPNEAGLYALRVARPKSLPQFLYRALNDRKHNLIYIGVASKSINKRLNQELWARGHGTFFRSLGASLGYRPPKGSLIDKKNKKNFKFSVGDERKIIQWIETNLTVHWIEMSGNLKVPEELLIRKYQPLLNIQGNPGVLQEVVYARGGVEKLH